MVVFSFYHISEVYDESSVTQESFPSNVAIEPHFQEANFPVWRGHSSINYICFISKTPVHLVLF